MVAVIQQQTCGWVIRSVMNENGRGSVVAGLLGEAREIDVSRATRGGVPVLSRPSVRPRLRSESLSSIAAGSPMRPPGVCSSPVCIRPRRNVPVATTTADGGGSCEPSLSRTPVTRGRTCRAAGSARIASTPASMIVRLRAVFQVAAEDGGVEPAVGLGARRPDGGALAAVEHAELDAGLVGDEAHEAAEGVDLADDLALADAADGGVAGHAADRRRADA